MAPRSPRTPRKKAPAKPAATPRPGLEEQLVAKYARAGTAALGDDAPKRLDPTLRGQMETLTGADLSDVRVHTGSGARRMASALGAKAFAAGEGDVFFARDQFRPGTPEGQALLAHELTHVAEGQAGLQRVPTRPQREQAESRARRAEELVLAKESPAQKAGAEQALREPERVRLPAAKEGAGEAEGNVQPVDKAVLEQKVWERLERETRRQRERTGR
jgi:hypothetical protein